MHVVYCMQGKEGEEEEEEDDEKEKATGHPKARHGRRYPCPALVFLNDGYHVSRAAAPDGSRVYKVL